MAKSANPQATALEALARALADPTPKLMLGSKSAPGFFTGSSAPVKAAARLCEERGWLAPTGELVGKGKSRKPTYRLTPAGLQAVLQHSEPLQLLRGLEGTLRQQLEVFTALREQMGRLLEGARPVAEAVAALTARMEPPDVEQIVRRMGQGGTPASAPPQVAGDWLEQAVQLVREQQQRDRYQPLTLPQLFAALRRSHPVLTLGQFHDGLRTLRDQGRIRLSPWTRALATLDDARNALFLDGEVMYYVEPR
jgi:hypothetical protein